MSKPSPSHPRKAAPSASAPITRRGRAPLAITAEPPTRQIKRKCGISTFPRALRHMLVLVRKKPDEAAFQCQGELQRAEKSCNEKKYRLACVAYELATYVKASEKRWFAFADLPFWKGYRLTMCPDDILRLSMMFMHGSRQGPIARDAHDHARSLRGAWNRQTSTTDVYYELQSGGFSGMKDADRKKDGNQYQEVSPAGRKQVFFIDESADPAVRGAMPGDKYTMSVELFEAVPKPIFLVTHVSKMSDAAAPRGRSRHRGGF